jgi:hypothetical protein
MSPRNRTAWIAGLFLVCIATAPAAARGDGLADDLIAFFKLFVTELETLFDFDGYEWTEINPDAPWAPRAGLESVELHGRFYVMGGRTPLPPPAPPFASIIQRDVWASDDRGATWQYLGEAPWPERAFFEAVTRGGYIYVLGGQSFDLVCVSPNGCPPVPVSRFYNDVWRSRDGVNWKLLTANAGWEGRAGLSSVVHKGRIWVFAGAQGDDEAIGGSGRVFFRDVWKSVNGRRWIRVADEVPWAGRGGAAAVVKKGWIYLLGGEAGFLEPPFSDVWRTRNGRDWQLLNANAWLPRSGHKCGVLQHNIFCFGGFNLFGNPLDVQRSPDGIHWRALEPTAAPPWQVTSPEDVKYDFDIVVTKEGALRRGIYTFGGDRETFDAPPPPDDLRVDNDVWRFAPLEHLGAGAPSPAARSRARTDAGDTGIPSTRSRDSHHIGLIRA